MWRPRPAARPRSPPTVRGSANRCGTGRRASWCRTATPRRSRRACSSSLPTLGSWRGWVARRARSPPVCRGSARRGQPRRTCSASSLREREVDHAHHDYRAPLRHPRRAAPAGARAARAPLQGRRAAARCPGHLRRGSRDADRRGSPAYRAGPGPRRHRRWRGPSLRPRPGGGEGAAAARQAAPAAGPRAGPEAAVTLPKVRDLLERKGNLLQLEALTGDLGLDREMPTPEASSPGLVLAGFTKRFAQTRIHVLGQTEITYLASLDAAARRRSLEPFFTFALPCVVVTKGQEPPSELLELARAKGIAVIRTKLKTSEFYRRLKPYLDEVFAPTTTVHGSLADVFGVGLLFVGRS